MFIYVKLHNLYIETVFFSDHSHVPLRYTLLSPHDCVCPPNFPSCPSLFLIQIMVIFLFSFFLNRQWVPHSQDSFWKCFLEESRIKSDNPIRITMPTVNKHNVHINTKRFYLICGYKKASITEECWWYVTLLDKSYIKSSLGLILLSVEKNFNVNGKKFIISYLAKFLIFI